MHRIAYAILLLSSFGLANLANAQLTASAIYQGNSPELFGAVPLGNTSTITRTISRSSGSSVGAATKISVAATGAGYTITGGTCLASPTLYPPSPADSCTVTMAFAPPALGAASGNLAIDCTIVGLVGGITVNCDSPPPPKPGTRAVLATTNIALQGTGIAGTPASLPTAGRFGLSMLALLLFGFALRSMRRRPQV